MRDLECSLCDGVKLWAGQPAAVDDDTITPSPAGSCPDQALASL